MSVTCNVLGCDTGKIDFEKLLISLFAKDGNGCVVLKLVELDETDAANLDPLPECAMSVTLEQVLKQAIVDDGNGGYALGVFKLSV